MRIFVAGATGALGRRLVPALTQAGHDVVGMTRSTGNVDALTAGGAEALVADALDRQEVVAAVTAAKPEVVVHQLTALSQAGDLRHFDRDFAMTNRLRTEGLDHLLAGARAAGARRFIAQSYTGWTNERAGGRVKTEEDPLDPKPTPMSRETLAAIRYLESTVPGADDLDGLVLRYGTFYGPGTSLGADGEILEAIRRRRFPLVGSGAGISSFVHIDDAASATVAAADRGTRGLYNIVDDDPAQVREWLPYLTAAIRAKPPMRVPAWLARMMIGEHGIAIMTAARGSSNAKAKRELGWQLRYPSWREGFRTGLG